MFVYVHVKLPVCLSVHCRYVVEILMNETPVASSFYSKVRRDDVN